MTLRIAILVLLSACSAWGGVAHTHDDAGLATNIAHSGNATANLVSSNSITVNFTFTAANTNDDVLIAISCGATSATPSSVSLTASGWTLTQVGAIAGSTTQGFLALFKAYAPNTSAATLTQTWTGAGGNGCANFMADLAVGFSGGDGTNFIDASNVVSGASGCNAAGTVTPVASNDGIWFACLDNVSGTVYTNGYTKGGDDTTGDVASWKILSGGSGVAQTPGYPTTTGNLVVWGIAIKPAAAGGVVRHRAWVIQQ